MLRPFLVLAVTVPTLALAGCGEATSADSAPQIEPTPVLDQYTEPVDIDDFYGFTAETLTGSRIRGADLRDRRLALWFWAPWCTICNEEAPAVVRLARQHPEVEFFGVAGKDEVDNMNRFVETYGIEFDNLHDPDGSLWRHFGVLAQPAWIFVTSRGEVRIVNGAPNESEVEQILDALSTD